MMVKILTGCILLISFLACPNLEAVANDLILKISMDKTTFHINEPIVIKVEIINSGERTIDIHNSFILEDHFLRFDIRDPDGRRVKFMGVERKIRIDLLPVTNLYPMAFYGQYINLLEGGNINEFNKNAKLYQIDKKGSYKIKAIYQVIQGREKTWSGSLSSNELTFTIK